MTPSVSVDAELVVEREGNTYRVWDEDDRLVVDAPSLAALRALDDLTGVLPVDVASLGPNLAAAGLRVDVQVRRATVARAGAGVTGGPLGRRLVGEGAAVDLRGVAVAAIRALG